MHEVALRINEDVSVVPVLHIEQVVKQRVAGQALREVLLCLNEVLPEILFIKRPQGPSLSILRELFLKLVNRDCIRYKLYETGRA